MVVFPPHSLPTDNTAAVRVLQVRATAVFICSHLARKLTAGSWPATCGCIVGARQITPLPLQPSRVPFRVLSASE